MKTLILCLLPLLFCCLTCDTETPQPRPDPELPPATTTGANTFGMLVNGEVWLPQLRPGGLFESKLYLSYRRGEFNLSATRRIDEEDIYDNVRIGFFEPTIFSTGTYNIRMYKSMFSTFGGGGFNSINCNYETDSVNNGTLTITRLDTVNHIISGTFEMTLVNEKSDCIETIRITEGRFDIQR